MKISKIQELAIKSVHAETDSIRETSLKTGHSRDTVRRVILGGGDGLIRPETDPEPIATPETAGIDYDKLCSMLAARFGLAAPVNEGPPAVDASQEWRQPIGPGIVMAPRIYERTVWLSDLHVPYHDQAAVDAALDFCSDWKPSLVILGGDLFDSYLISRFTKSPEQLNHHLQREFDLAKPFVKAIESLQSDVVYILGNHEARIDALKAEVPGLAKLRALEWHNMAELPARWQILPQFSRYRIGSLDYHHGDLKHGPGGRYVAARMLEDLKRSSLFGHFHRNQDYFEPDGDGVVRGAFGSSHLCDPVEAAKYCRLNRWTTGFKSVDADPSTSLFEVRSHLIHGGRMRSGGKTYGG